MSQGSPSRSKEQDQPAAPYDFSRLDRIPKSQLRAIQLLHETFARNLASSLSAYLRTSIAFNLASIEQVSYSEFVESIVSPACICYLSLQPFDGTAVLEISTSLVFNLMEILLGGNGKGTAYPKRKITEIEGSLVEIILRIILQDLSEAWRRVTEINFVLQSLASEPQLLHILAPQEAIVVISIEMHIGTNTGVVNLALPSIFIKRLREKFEQLQQVRRAESKGDDLLRMSQLILPSNMEFEALLSNGTMTLGDFLSLDVDKIIPIGSGRPTFTGSLNGHENWSGQVVNNGAKLAFQIGARL